MNSNGFSMNPYNLKDGEMSSGTTIMGVVYRDGVVLGADSRTSTGSYIANRVADKIVPLIANLADGNSNNTSNSSNAASPAGTSTTTMPATTVWACRSGSAADTQAVVDHTRYALDAHCTELGRPCRVSVAARLLKSICYNNKDALMAGLIIGGWDAVEGPQLFEVPLGGTLMKQQVAVGGSGSSYIYGYVDANYKPDMTREEALAFVTTAISHAMARDGSSGGVVRTVTIDRNGATKHVIMGDKLPYLP